MSSRPGQRDRRRPSRRPERPLPPSGAGALPALRSHGQQRHQLPGRLRGRFRLLTGLRAALLRASLAAAAVLLPAGAGIGGARETGEAFGRWETELHTCSLQTGPEPERPCLRLRLEQNQAGLLSVRFLGPGNGELLAREEVLFAGVLNGAQPPLRCDGDGRCQAPEQPLQVTVGVVVQRAFDGRGLATGLPQGQLARGRCLIGDGSVHCEAALSPDTRWQAQARLNP